MHMFKRFINLISDMTFLKKMMIIYLLCVLCPLLTISVYYYRISSESTEQQKRESFEKIIESAAKGIEDCINSAIIDGEYLGVNNTIYTMLSTKDGDRYDFYSVASNIDSMVRGFNSLGVVDSLMIYCDNPSLYRNSSVIFLDDNIRDTQWYKDYKENDGLYYLYSVTEGDIYNECGDIVILYEGSHSWKSDREIIFKITLGRDRITEILRRNALDGKFYLADADGRIIASSETEMFDGGCTDKSVQEVYEQEGFEFITYELNMPKDFILVARYDKFSIKDIISGLTPGFFIIVLINLVFASVIIALISLSLSGRINLVTETMKKMSNQQFELMEENGAGNDEIGVLIKGTNNAIYKINNLIEKVYVAEIEKQDATLKALHSQINPHFMFNMLEVIRLNAMMKKETETAENIKNLSKMLRKIITWGKDVITVKEELTFVDAYLKLQKYRLGNECRIEVEADEKALLQMIPKMAIQVFVENAFVHGLLGDEEKVIKISVKRNGDRVEYSVYDNGTGIDAITLEKIKNKEIISEKNIGIMNVLKRMTLCYGDCFDFEISSLENEFTLVKIDMPYNTDEIYTGEVSEYAEGNDS